MFYSTFYLEYPLVNFLDLLGMTIFSHVVLIMTLDHEFIKFKNLNTPLEIIEICKPESILRPSGAFCLVAGPKS